LNLELLEERTLFSSSAGLGASFLAIAPLANSAMLRVSEPPTTTSGSVLSGDAKARDPAVTGVPTESGSETYITGTGNTSAAGDSNSSTAGQSTGSEEDEYPIPPTKGPSPHADTPARPTQTAVLLPLKDSSLGFVPTLMTLADGAVQLPQAIASVKSDSTPDAKVGPAVAGPNAATNSFHRNDALDMHMLLDVGLQHRARAEANVAGSELTSESVSALSTDEKIAIQPLQRVMESDDSGHTEVITLKRDALAYSSPRAVEDQAGAARPAIISYETAEPTAPIAEMEESDVDSSWFETWIKPVGVFLIVVGLPFSWRFVAPKLDHSERPRLRHS
jgi:hypothetical protein